MLKGTTLMLLSRVKAVSTEVIYRQHIGKKAWSLFSPSCAPGSVLWRRNEGFFREVCTSATLHGKVRGNKRKNELSEKKLVCVQTAYTFMFKQVSAKGDYLTRT